MLRCFQNKADDSPPRPWGFQELPPHLHPGLHSKALPFKMFPHIQKPPNHRLRWPVHSTQSSQLPLRPTTDPPPRAACPSSELDLSNASPATALSGIKRGRSGRPKLAGECSSRCCPSSTAEHGEPSGSESGFESSESDSDFDSHSDDESPHEHDLIWDKSTLPSSHIYHSLQPAMIQFAFDRFCKWRASVWYIIPPEHRLSRPRKRARTRMYMEEASPDDPEVIFISAFDGYYHLGCPFYISDPVRHQRCLFTQGMRSIKDVISHLQDNHAGLLYCPICGSVFETATGRDQHIRAGTCELRDNIKMAGLVDDHQLAMMVEQDDVSQPEEDRWDCLYATVFGSESGDRSPYLTEGLGLSISLLRDFWSSQGDNCISEYLSSQHIDTDEDFTSKSLQLLVLRDVAQMVLQREDSSENESKRRDSKSSIGHQQRVPPRRTSQ
ncbi:hypothetical protein B0H63DRAFT_489370 [Podospora didyma]|uniref:Uncharacterized protein n=1 Tax=Podospora didyma TaxID=330526 RepID=A0AAE0K0T9_9PEZI|nr:hypothetical protein B0H63DRAFT_489370 [Podospora didyma]